MKGCEGMINAQIIIFFIESWRLTECEKI
jgi:hypothetical protein